MDRVDTRPPFFPRARNQHLKAKEVDIKKSLPSVKTNSLDRTEELKTKTANDARVSINDGIKDFSKIRRAVDSAPEMNREDRLAQLKQQIQSGEYEVDYDAVADKLLSSEY